MKLSEIGNKKKINRIEKLFFPKIACILVCFITEAAPDFKCDNNRNLRSSRFVSIRSFAIYLAKAPSSNLFSYRRELERTLQ